RGLAAERLDQLDVARLVRIGLDVVQARLAEEIERERLPGAPGVEARAARLLRRAARDEAPGQAAHGLAQHHADDGVAEPAGHARDAERRVEEPGVRRVTPLEVLAQVADEIAVAVEGGEHVDETEELELGLLVSERPREERGGPAGGRRERLAGGGDAVTSPAHAARAPAGGAAPGRGRPGCRRPGAPQPRPQHAREPTPARRARRGSRAGRRRWA